MSPESAAMKMSWMKSLKGKRQVLGRVSRLPRLSGPGVEYSEDPKGLHDPLPLGVPLVVLFGVEPVWGFQEVVCLAVAKVVLVIEARQRTNRPGIASSGGGA